MAVLSSKQILQENNTRDHSSIKSLTLTHKALSDVSCLGEFKNLERLDLGFNSLTSLEGLKSCVNLKWLSVVQNKLQNLKGIEGLTKLTVVLFYLFFASPFVESVRSYSPWLGILFVKTLLSLCGCRNISHFIQFVSVS